MIVYICLLNLGPLFKYDWSVMYSLDFGDICVDRPGTSLSLTHGLGDGLFVISFGHL